MLCLLPGVCLEEQGLLEEGEHFDTAQVREHVLIATGQLNTPIRTTRPYLPQLECGWWP